jgi:hypothetical protein
MGEKTTVQTTTVPVVQPPAFMTAGKALLQRKCMCGESSGAGDKCAECKKKDAPLQRRSFGGGETPAVPQIVHEVVRSSGQPLDPTTCAFFEPRFGHDFSKLSVYDKGGLPESIASFDRMLKHQPARYVPSCSPVEGIACSGPAPTALDAGVSPDAGDTGMAPTAPRGPAAPVAGPAAPALSWTYVLKHKNDALWFFCGEHPSGFSTSGTLRAAGAADPSKLNWRIASGADKVEFDGAPAGPEVKVKTKAGSKKADDVAIEVVEGPSPGAPRFTGTLTVLKPHRLIHRADTDHGACPGWAACPVACTAFWTEIGYRVVDNMGGTIVGATVNENFPGAKVNDQANNWVAPAAFATAAFWANTNGTFVDNWFESCGAPAPVAPGTPNAGQAVDHIAHEFYVGSQTPAHGCRVQTHTAQRFRGMARHINVVSPAP